MSLVISLRVPDGIVVAADSLATAVNLVGLAAQNIELRCPHCNHEVKGPELQLPPIHIPFSASSYTQKLFPLHRNYAVGYYGQAVVNGRSIYYHIKQFERENKSPASLKDTRDALITYLEEELLQQYPKYKQEAPPKWLPLSFHINGHETVENKPVGVTYEVHIGRENSIKRWDTIGCTVGGDIKLVQKLWEIGTEDQRRQFKYPFFSLQDAIDLSEFLINTTSTFQRFANEVPTVGGAIDVALLTPLQGFQWIKQKTLMEILEAKSNVQDT